MITAAKQPLNAILFVFKKDRVDTHALQQASLLFRELGKAKALKILVINDHTNYDDDDDDADEDEEARKQEIQDALAAMAEEIEHTTTLHFDAQILISDKKEMPSKIAELKKQLSQCPKPEKSESLKTFEELRDDVATLTDSTKMLRRVTEELQEKIAYYKSKMLVDPDRRLAYTLAIGVAGVATVGGVIPALGVYAHDRYWEYKLNEATKQLGDPKALEQLSLELEEAVKKFEELDKALRLGTEELPGQPGSGGYAQGV